MKEKSIFISSPFLRRQKGCGSSWKEFLLSREMAGKYH
jgi:hypothetical protein